MTASSQPREAATEPLRLPQFLGGEFPEPESFGRKLFIRSFAGITLLLTSGYVLWRAAFTVDLDVWYVSLPLMIAETHSLGGFLLFTLSLWDRDVRMPWRKVDHTHYKLAVLIPTYNEPEEVLLPTVAAAVKIDLPHETWVLDDGRREWVAEMASQLGARYLTRPDNRHAKAGNLNHALEVIDADLIGVLDADHVPRPAFLQHTVGYFDDPAVAAVQTPQDFYNLDSFEHSMTKEGESFNEEAIFYRVIAPAKNRWGSAFWCGTSAVVRVAALRSVGGVATSSVTEDIHTTMKLNRRGWKVVYHNEVLARGLAPTDAGQYLLQRNRWAMGAMQVLRQENPIWTPGFTLGQRLAFSTTLVAWFDSWRSFIFMVLPMLVAVTGASPIHAPGNIYGPLFITVFVMQFITLRLLARGYYPAILSLVFETLRMPAVLPATLALFRGGAGKFAVTPKGATEGDRVQGTVPGLLWALLFINGFGLFWFTLTMLGLTLAPYREVPAAVGAATFGTLDMALVIAAISRIRDWRYASERRNSVRFPVSVPATLDGVACTVFDLSLNGALVRMPAPVTAADEARPGMLTMALPEGPADLYCTLRPQAWRGPDVLSAEFANGQRPAVGAVARAMFWGVDVPESTPPPVAGVA